MDFGAKWLTHHQILLHSYNKDTVIITGVKRIQTKGKWREPYDASECLHELLWAELGCECKNKSIPTKIDSFLVSWHLILSFERVASWVTCHSSHEVQEVLFLMSVSCNLYCIPLCAYERFKFAWKHLDAKQKRSSFNREL